MYKISFISFFLIGHILYAQSIRGKIVSETSLNPVENVLVSVKKVTSITDANGNFLIKNIPLGNHILEIKAEEFHSKKLPIILTLEHLDLGTLYITHKTVDSRANTIDLNLDNLNDDDEQGDGTIGVFQSSKNIYLRRVAFDFSQAFFKVRGYDSSENLVMIQGLSMNTLSSGRPQWSQWGGLNDVTRIQDYSFGLYSSNYYFGTLSSTTNITIAPEKSRQGLHLTTSIANKSYSSRLMITYNSSLLSSKWAYSISASHRYAGEGFIQGTPYGAYSVFSSISYSPSLSNTFGIVGLHTSVRRGSSSAITREAMGYAGYRYNPLWGYQNGKKRNSREKNAMSSMVILYHNIHKRKLNLNSAFAFQKYSSDKSRLHYNNAPNPDPLYYRNLPSYILGKQVKENPSAIINYFKDNMQVDWNNIYSVNSNIKDGLSAYILYGDINDNSEFKISSLGNFRISKFLHIDFGLTGQFLSSLNYAAIKDFLGSQKYKDADPFSDTQNDLLSSTNEKSQLGAKIKYNYAIEANRTHLFLQSKWYFKKVNAFTSIAYTYNYLLRTGLFKNERYDDSFGKSNIFNFHDFSITSGLTYKIFGKHAIQISGMYKTKSPEYSKIFYNIRETNHTLSNLIPEKITAVDINYILNTPSTNIKISLFGTHFKDGTNIGFFYADSGVGSHFFQETTTNIEKIHLGIEAGLEYALSPSIQINMAGSLGQYRYTNNPNVTVNFKASKKNDNLITSKDYIDLGSSALKNYASASTPQNAISIGMKYNSSKYWWIASNLSFMNERYISISKFMRTSSFFSNPDDPDGLPFPNISKERTRELLKQERLGDIFLLNLSGGKSWLIKGNYYRAMIVVNNLLGKEFLSGGYEQSRLGNYQALNQDKLKPTPTFGSKYWQGYGRTFFINLSASF